MVATDLRKRFSTTVLTTTREKTAVINGDMSSIYQLFMYRTVLYGAKEVDKILHMPLGSRRREFESPHSDQNRQFSGRKLAVFDIVRSPNAPCCCSTASFRGACFQSAAISVATFSQKALSCSTNRIVGWNWISNSSICIREITSI